MRKLTKTLCLTLALFLGSVGVSASADFQKGLTAYESGDYATALREWTPLAKNEGVSSLFYSKENVISAQHKLGVMYGKGEGVLQDYKTAVKWYKLAAEQGNEFAQYSLGLMYSRGKGVKQDYKTAVKWYRLAAEQGDAHAQYNLGLMYDKGDGVKQDFKTAVKWYRLAAEQGDAHAQTSLSIAYAYGDGVIQDDVYAHMWGNIAASNGDELGAELRYEAAEKLNPSQLEKAQDLARECVRKKYKGC